EALHLGEVGVLVEIDLDVLCERGAGEAQSGRDGQYSDLHGSLFPSAVNGRFSSPWVEIVTLRPTCWMAVRVVRTRTIRLFACAANASKSSLASHGHRLSQSSHGVPTSRKIPRLNAVV